MDEVAFTLLLEEMRLLQLKIDRLVEKVRTIRLLIAEQQVAS